MTGCWVCQNGDLLLVWWGTGSAWAAAKRPCKPQDRFFSIDDRILDTSSKQRLWYVHLIIFIKLFVWGFQFHLDLVSFVILNDYSLRLEISKESYGPKGKWLRKWLCQKKWRDHPNIFDLQPSGFGQLRFAQFFPLMKPPGYYDPNKTLNIMKLKWTLCWFLLISFIHTVLFYLSIKVLFLLAFKKLHTDAPCRRSSSQEQVCAPCGMAPGRLHQAENGWSDLSLKSCFFICVTR